MARIENHKYSIDSEFLTLALSSEQTQIHLSMMKTGLAESQTNISQEIVRRLKFTLPHPNEQKQIARRIRNLDDLLAKEKALLSKCQVQKSGLMQDLLTGKVRVKVDERVEVPVHA